MRKTGRAGVRFLGEPASEGEASGKSNTRLTIIEVTA